MTGARAANGLDPAGAWLRQRFNVEYAMPVAFVRDAFAPHDTHLRDLLTQREPGRRHRMVVFADSGVLVATPGLTRRIAAYATAHADSIELVGAVVPVAGGEACKNDPDLPPRLLAILLERAVDRHSYAVAIGGGALLDAVGYAAAIFHRGVRHIRLPSTVLAQCDSGVGVKNAVNWRGQKNLLGTFSPPWGVINDSLFIESLPVRERRAGMAEAVKVALIRDHAFFEEIERDAVALAEGRAAPLTALIRRCAALHMRQIAHGGDPFERGSARPLDFGHWAAHKLERLSGHALAHGEAVAIGVALDARYSVLEGLLAPGADARIHRLLARLGFRLWHPQLQAMRAGRPAVLDGLGEFRAHLGGDLSVTMLSDIGVGVELRHIDTQRMAQAIGWLHAQEEERACA